MNTQSIPEPNKNRPCVTTTTLALAGKRVGKVRELYELPCTPGAMAQLLIIATDRLSAFDVVLPTAIANKGKLLTRISLHWFQLIRSWNIIADHVMSDDANGVAGISQSDKDMLRGRCMICRKVQIVPIECVVRGWLAGSGFAQYQRGGNVCGVHLPAGLKQWSQLPQPIFTPASKAETGHDENISFEQACDAVGASVMMRLRQASLDIYQRASEHCAKRGLILADTKFEFGFALDAQGNTTDELVLADEVLTPDSSRYWIAASMDGINEPQSLDKQFVRNWLLAEETAGRWNRTPPGPELPADVVNKTISRYEQAANMLCA